MAYIGAVAPGYDPTRASVPQLDAERFSGNSSTTAFTLTRQVVSPTDINVIVENVLQEPTVAYSVNGYTLNFTEAPNAGTNNVYVIYRGSATSNYAYVPDGSITYAKLANNIKQFTVDTFTANGTGSTVALTETPASANAVIVSVDGVIQTAPTNYTLSGSTITFTGVPESGANVVVKHIGFRTTSTVTALQASSVTATELADSSVTNAKIVSVANTKITGNIVSSQITSVANTQITGNIVSSQITSVGGSQITANTIANSAFQTGAVENYMNATGLSFGMRNRIINGAMVIDQRTAGTYAAYASGSFIVDRWSYTASQASKFILGQNLATAPVTPPSGYTYYLGAQVNSAVTVGSTDYFQLLQAIEGFNVADLGWGTANAKTVTLSFWVRSSLTGTFGGALRNSGASRCYPFTYTISSANTWEQKSITVAGDTSGTWLTTNGYGLGVNFSLGMGSTYSGTAGAWASADYGSATGAVSVVGTASAVFYITGVQLEKGSTATSFDYRPYGTELALCQRYCYVMRSASTLSQVGFSSAQSTTSAFLGIYLPVTPRTNPTGITASSATCLNSYAGNINVTTTAIGVSSGWTFAGNFVTMLLTTAGSLVAGQVSPTYFNSATATIEFTGMEL